MNIQAELIKKLVAEQGSICVSIILNTHKSFPDNKQDSINLKNLCKEAINSLVSTYDKREVNKIIEKIEQIQGEVDHNHNEESLHIFISDSVLEVVRSPFPVVRNQVYVEKEFWIKPLLNTLFHNKGYSILLLSKGGAHVYEAFNDHIIGELRGSGFPYKDSGFYHTDPVKQNDPKAVDDMVKEYLNRVDKSVNQLLKERELRCLVISTEDNYSKLLHVADNPEIYMGHSPIDYNHVAEHQLAKQAWEYVKNIQKQERAGAIREVKKAVSLGKVLTDPGEIYRAATEGRGELLIIHERFSQPGKILANNTLELLNNKQEKGVLGDISSHIAAEVLTKKGRVLVTAQEELNELGNIALKLRY